MPHVNRLAVVAGAMSSFVLGGLWCSALFAKRWQAALLATSLATAACWALPAFAAEPPRRPDIVDTSAVAPSGERVLRESVVVDAPADEVWRLVSTSEGLKAWQAPLASIDLRIGGLMQASYDPRATLGDASTITHEIIAYLPGSLLVFRNRRTPANFPWPEAFEKIRNIIQIEAVDPTRTRVTISGVGYGAADQPLYDFFRNGNAELLVALSRAAERRTPH